MSTIWFALRRRLLKRLLGGLAVCWLVVMAWSYIETHHEIDELLDKQLIVESDTLLAIASHEAGEMMPFDDHRSRHDYKHLKNFRFQIWDDEGQLLMVSPNAPAIPMADADGFSTRTDATGGNHHWRYYAQWSEDRTLRIIVGQNDKVRHELIGKVLWQLLLPALFGLPIIGAWLWLTIRQGLRPLNQVAEQIAARRPERLDALEPATAPEEIRPLVESINKLFKRVAQTMEVEKRFTADAAHELRTPLAGLAAQAQVALRARDEAERQHALEQLIASSRRSARLVDQLLTLARLDPSAPMPVGQVQLNHLAGEVCALNGPLAVTGGVTLELDAAPAAITGDPDLLHILLRNLIDNAIRYTPSGGRVLVSVKDKTITVTDSGIGIPAAEREQVFDRFYRLAGQEKEGSGLGLSIVARIVDLHHAHIQLADGYETGLKVTVTFRE
ncbi:MAG: sensor histidine kinase N-terminal domain-containing protein, partial [Zoogloeaceae bacterium]|nr:sensor histidine kinase N-terminal domain-containing protein [Zoogloeaceae bacterium]